MRKLLVLFCTTLLLTFSSCIEKDTIIPFTNKEGTTNPLIIQSLYLDCIADVPFVVRASYNDQTNGVLFEYYDNLANSSTKMPVSINWFIDNGSIPVADSGESSGTSFIFNRNHTVGVSIVFDDNSTFQDQFCVNINQLFPTEFNVCSDHKSTINCQEKGISDRMAMVIIDVIF